MVQTNPKGMMATEEKDRPEVEATGMEELEIKSKTTLFKLVSVTVYVSAVFGNGFMLAVFFLFIWDDGITAERPAGIAPDRGLLSRWAPARLVADRLVAYDDDILAERLKNPILPPVPYRRIMSEEFTNNYINNFHRINGGNSDIPDAPRALPLYTQEEYDNKGSTVKPASNSPRYTRSTNMHDYDIGSEEGFDSTSSSDGGPMAKPKMTGSAITSH